jgi:hypothetical protein
MSGPQGPESTRPWQPNQGEGQQGSGEDQTVQSPWQQSGSDQQTWQAPAYTPSEYSPYQQPTSPYYPPSQQFGYPQQQPGYSQQPGYPQQQPGYPQQQPGYPPQQPGPYPGQPGPYGPYPGQPGPYGQPPQRPKRSLGVIGAVIGTVAAIVIAVVLVTGFWEPGFFVTTKLDINKAQQGVQQILTDQTNGYGAKNVKDVVCNQGKGDPVVKKGDSFTCDVSIDGTKRHVTVTFQDDKGTYEVGRPQ